MKREGVRNQLANAPAFAGAQQLGELITAFPGDV